MPRRDGAAPALHAIGASHGTTPLGVRERLAVAPGEAARLAVAMRAAGAAEAAVLSTCHRTECYVVAASRQEALSAVRLGFCAAKGEDLFGDDAYPFAVEGDEAVRHLLRVACGLESMVLGDVQVVGQVRHAYELSRAAGTVGPVLHRVFQATLRIAKRVRAETTIAEGTVSVASAAVELVGPIHADLAGLDVAIVGAGDTARRLAHHVACLHPRALTVVNRTRAHADAVARPLGAESRPLEALPSVLEAADVAWFATGAPGLVLDARSVDGVMHDRARPLMLVDLALPRDVDPAARRIPGVTLFDLDSLRSIVDRGLARRAAAVPAACQLIGAEIDRMTAWRTRRDARAAVVA